MAKNSIDAYGASGKSNVLFFNPDALHLVDDPSHPLYDERIHLPIDDAMVMNIADQGVLETIIIWKDPETGRVCVVDGRQRVKHTREANKRLQAEGKEPHLVPGVARRGSAVRMSQAMVSANEIRRADTPLGRAKKMASMLERGHDEKDLALLFGCTAATVKNTLSLLDCTQAVQDAVEAGRISSGTARKLAELSPEEQREKVAEISRVESANDKPRERLQKQRQVMGETVPRMKTRKQIERELAEARAEGANDYASALAWVLGEK